MAQIDEVKVRELFAQGDSEKSKELADVFNRLVAAINALDTRVTALEDEGEGG
jgi:hypothetical protein